MRREEIEALYLKSLDGSLSADEKRLLMEGLEADKGLAAELEGYERVREAVRRKEPATFGPYFAQKVILRIQNTRVEIDQQIAFFFKKYQLAVIGVFVALLTINVIFSDTVDLPSLLGIHDETAVPSGEDDEIESFDFTQYLTNN